VIKKFLAIGVSAVADKDQPVFVLDHDIQNRSDANLDKYRRIEEFAAAHGIRFYPAGTGIGHQIMVSHGFVVPGALVVGSDSHSNMYGALGALGTPVVRTDAAAIWATGEVLNAAVEFHGSGVAGLSMDERFTISNMTTEWGALVGWFPVDEVTVAYLRARRETLGQAGAFDRFSESELEDWATDPPRPSSAARYAGVIELDLSRVTPHVSGPDSVQVMRSVADIEAEKVAIQKAYLVSCVNSRLEDLESAAVVLQGQQVADGVEMYVAAASREVQEAAEASGAWGTLVEAGAHTLPPGCGPCIGLGMGLLEPGEVGISATNRNFKGRMGSRDAQAYLASPAVVAASAVAGYIRAPEATNDGSPPYLFRLNDPDQAETVEVQMEPGFPASHHGRLVFVGQDNLNTDGIYGKDFTYREGMTPEEMAEVVMRNYDPDFASAVEPGDVLVGCYNFGTGSSREQAATALQAAGIALVIAGSFSQTYLRNAFNNGFVCIECPALVDRLKRRFVDESSPTLIPGDLLDIDFAHGTVTLGEEGFSFVPLGAVPQALIVAGGIENQIRARLGFEV